MPAQPDADFLVTSQSTVPSLLVLSFIIDTVAVAACKHARTVKNCNTAATAAGWATEPDSRAPIVAARPRKFNGIIPFLPILKVTPPMLIDEPNAGSFDPYLDSSNDIPIL
jgi:hypothetical protein